MAKKWIAALLVLAMAVQMLPVSALAAENATQSYTTGFTVLPAQDQMEKEFRKWASSVVDYYRSSSYTDLIEDTNVARTTSIASYVLSGGKWKIDGNLTQINGSAFAPYYLAGQKKFEFDQSMDAAAQNAFGNVTRYTYYTDVDLYENPDKAQEIYEWLLIMTLKEKAELEPGFLTGNDNILPDDKNGWYSFNVETGKMEYDSSLEAVQKMSNAQCAESILKSAVSLAEVAFEGYQAYQKIKGQTGKIASNAANKIKNTVDTDQLVKDLKDDLLSAIVDAVTDGLDELIEEECTAIKNGLQNGIREYQACELSNAVLTANKNVIGYLKTTYINSDTMLDTVKGGYTTHTQGFRDAAQKIIGVLESEQARGATEEEVRKALQDVALDMTGLMEVLPKNVIAYDVATKTINSMLSGVFQAFHDCLKELADQLISTKVSKSTGEYLKVLRDFILTDVWDYVIKEAVVKGVEEGFSKHSPDEIGEDGNMLTFVSDVVTDVFNCILGKFQGETMWIALRDSITKRGMELAAVFLKQFCGDLKSQAASAGTSSGTSSSTSAGTSSSTSAATSSTSAGTSSGTSSTSAATSSTSAGTSSGTSSTSAGTSSSSAGTSSTSAATSSTSAGTSSSTSAATSSSASTSTTGGKQTTTSKGLITTEKEAVKKGDQAIYEKYRKGDVWKEEEVGIVHVVLSAILAMAEESLFSTDDKNSFAGCALSMATFLSEKDKSSFKAYMKDFDKTINTFVNSNPSDKSVQELMITLSTQWLAYCIWIAEADAAYDESLEELLLWNAPMEFMSNIKFDFQKGSSILKYYINNGEFFKLVIKLLTGYDLQELEEDAYQMKYAYEFGETLHSKDSNPTREEKWTYWDMYNWSEDIPKYLETNIGAKIGKLLLNIQEIASSVWDKCFELGGRIVVAKNDAENALTGENDASLMAIRLYVTYRNSELLYNSLRNCTIGNYRTKAYQNGGVNGLQYFIDGGGGAGSSTSNQLKMSINSREILDPILTPDLETIKALTDTILMQANLDYVGVGAYITLLENREKLSDTRFYKKYLNKGVLFTESYIEDCLIDIGELVQYQNTYDPNWDALFIH